MRRHWRVAARTPQPRESDSCDQEGSGNGKGGFCETQLVRAQGEQLGGGPVLHGMSPFGVPVCVPEGQRQSIVTGGIVTRGSLQGGFQSDGAIESPRPPTRDDLERAAVIADQGAQDMASLRVHQNLDERDER